MIYSFDGKKPVIGKCTYVSEHALVIGDVQIDDNCYIGPGAILRGDYGRIEIGAGSAVEEGVIVHAPPGRVCRIGNRVTIGHGAIVHASSIDDLAVIGMGAILSLGAKIGEKAIVAEGAIVKMRQKVAPSVVVGGNPSKVLRDVTVEDEEYWEIGKQTYIDLAKKYIAIGMQPIA